VTQYTGGLSHYNHPVLLRIKYKVTKTSKLMFDRL